MATVVNIPRDTRTAEIGNALSEAIGTFLAAKEKKKDAEDKVKDIDWLKANAELPYVEKFAGYLDQLTPRTLASEEGMKASMDMFQNLYGHEAPVDKKSMLGALIKVFDIKTGAETGKEGIEGRKDVEEIRQKGAGERGEARDVAAEKRVKEQIESREKIAKGRTETAITIQGMKGDLAGLTSGKDLSERREFGRDIIKARGINLEDPELDQSTKFLLESRSSLIRDNRTSEEAAIKDILTGLAGEFQLSFDPDSIDPFITGTSLIDDATLAFGTQNEIRTVLTMAALVEKAKADIDPTSGRLKLGKGFAQPLAARLEIDVSGVPGVLAVLAAVQANLPEREDTVENLVSFEVYPPTGAVSSAKDVNNPQLGDVEVTFIRFGSHWVPATARLIIGPIVPEKEGEE